MPDVNHFSIYDAFQSGRQHGRERRQQQATENAFARYARGETDAAISDLALVNPEQANQLGVYNQSRIKQQIGQRMASGDVAGAKQLAASSGMWEYRKHLDDADEESRARGVAALGRSAEMAKALVESYPDDPSNPGAAEQQRRARALELAPQFGIDPSKVAGLDFSTASIERYYNEMRRLGAVSLPKLTEVSPDATLYDQRTNQAVFTAPAKDHWVAVPDGGSLVNTSRVGGVGNTAPQGAAVNVFGKQSYQAGTGTRADRNNNPGNLRDSGDRWQGMTGVDNGGFVQFDTQDNGVRAARINLANQQRLHGINTIAGLVSKYAPPSDNNDTAGYIQSVAQMSGFQPNQPLDFNDPATQDKLLQAMFRVESGGTPAQFDSGQPGNPNVIQGRPKAQTRLMTVQEKATYGIDADTPAQIRPDGTVDVISGAKPKLKQVPVKAQAGYQSNLSAIREIDEAVAMIRADPEAMGGANYFGDEIRQRADPSGVKVRATVANIGGKIIHDRAGASQTVTEVKRLKPYIPNLTDRHDVAITKLQQLRRAYENEIAQYEAAYGEDNGYQSSSPVTARPATGSPQQQRGANMNDAQRTRYRQVFKPGAEYGSKDNPFIVNNDAQFNGLKPGQHFIAPDGSVRIK
ncbi:MULTISPECIES: hypothetical protein [Asticcacaulis]|uniref:hypothetical protein n=1 Tax=Asticcacaulis TaxID=76890 RepID=UPI001AE4446A|nr:MULTISPECIES: hypothetical protein [Asticcacaulis]MBP2159549.1 hypothetical protein [Asticcacaulis solisilvae]MDR6800624.1 hypothetical protein [Asticcacaulis sp. BE141]